MKRNILWQSLVMASLLMNVGAVEAKDLRKDPVAGQAKQLNRVAQRLDTHQTTQNIAREFADFAGSQENAEALFTGLINATPILLNGVSKVERHGRSSLVSTHSMILPPTKPLSFGDAYVVMAMIRSQFAGAEIAQPSMQQLQSALVAGSDNAEMLNIGELQLNQRVLRQGVLTQRAAGKNWQSIAREQGVDMAPIQQALKAMSQPEKLAAKTETNNIPHLNPRPAQQLGVVTASSSVALGARAGGL